MSVQLRASLVTLYSEKHRHYHDMNHVNDCLAELEAIPHELLANKPAVKTLRPWLCVPPRPDRNVVEEAIWWHDAVYNPYSKFNEAASAVLYSRSCPYGVLPGVIEAIQASALHVYDQPEAADTTKWFLDIDLAGLGKSYQIYKRNGDNIRKEYYNTPDEDFYRGRLDFLTTICTRKTIYYTEYFQSKYEIRARENMMRDIAILTGAE